MLKFGETTSFEITVTVVSLYAVTIYVTGITKNGIINIKIPVAANAKNTVTQKVDDIPILLSAYNPAGGNFGATHISLDLVLNSDININLMQGYVTEKDKVTYPHNSSQSGVDKRGVISELFTANPAAGAEILYSAAGYSLDIIHFARVTLVTDATVANRRVHFKFQRTGDTVFETFSDQDQAASLTRVYTLAPYGFVTNSLNDNDILVPIPENLTMYADWVLATETTNKQAGDNFSSLYFQAERFANPTLF